MSGGTAGGIKNQNSVLLAQVYRAGNRASQDKDIKKVACELETLFTSIIVY